MWFIVIIGLVVPRLTAAILYLFTGWFGGVFQTWYVPLLGFIFMPYTLLWYSVVINWYGGIWGNLQIVVLVIAAALDITAYSRR